MNVAMILGNEIVAHPASADASLLEWRSWCNKYDW
jgi:hypothetical protein